MGQARRRGTYEERRLLAIAKKVAALERAELEAQRAQRSARTAPHVISPTFAVTKLATALAATFSARDLNRYFRP